MIAKPGNLIYVLLGFLLVYTGPLAAADTSSPAAPAASATQAVNKGVIEARLKEVESSTEYDDQTRASLLELYRKALSSLESMAASRDAEQAFRAARDNAPAETEALEKKLEQRKENPQPPRVDVDDNSNLSEVENLLLKEKADATAIDTKLNSLEEQIDRESKRPDQARKRLTEARLEQDTLNNKLKTPAPEGEIAALTEARRWQAQAQLQALNAEINMLDQELLSQPARLALLKAQRDTTQFNSEQVSARIELLDARLNKQRRSEVEEILAEAAPVADGEKRHPLEQQLLDDNVAFSERLDKLARRLEVVTSGDQAAGDSAKRIKEDMRRTQQKLEVGGISKVLGRILQEQQRLLPDVRDIRRESRKRESLISETALAQLTIEEELRKLRDLDTYVDTLLESEDPETALDIRGDLLEICETRRNLLKKTNTLGETYLRALGELDYAQNRLIDAVNEYDAFLSERLLWVRSGPAPNLEVLMATPAQVIDYISPRNWYQAFHALINSLFNAPWLLLMFIVPVYILYKRAHLRRLLIDTAKPIIKPATDSYRYTLKALAYTLLLALPWPMLLFLPGYALSSIPDPDPFSAALAHALIVLVPAYYYLSAFHALCIPGGLADRHFRWPGVSLRPLRRQIYILITVFIPSALIAVASIHYSTNSDGALPRIAFIVAVASLSWFFFRLLGTRNPALAAEFSRHPDSMLSRYRYLWLVLALVIPLMLATLAISGFLYTAAVLTGSLIDTLWLVLAALVVHQMAVRWLLMTQRKLDYQAALEERQRELAARAQDAPENDALIEDSEIEEPEIDLAALNDESVKLLNSAIILAAFFGLWFIWSEVLPAFGRFDEFALWHYNGVVDGESTLVPVTVADILIALLIGLVTLVAAKRFPALMEIVLLKRSSVSSASRYTATTLVRYVIAAVGTLLMLSSIGAQWSQVQWLAAALSVGIGFGLQEIVANFISGLIILFERPIRVGDVVTVGDTDGTVTRIQIRATTIRTWDRQELLVPNKEFITGRLLNWSLSDQMSRIRIPVGVAYGSDVEKARALMMEAAEENTLVMEDPGPYTIFNAFGDNTLNLELRCFVGSVDYRLSTITQLHEAINAKFNAAGICIAFPQRDVHLDTSQPLNVKIQQDGQPG